MVKLMVKLAKDQNQIRRKKEILMKVHMIFMFAEN